MTPQTPVIDYNEATTLPFGELWRQAQEAEIKKSLNRNYVLLLMSLPSGQKLIHKKWIFPRSMIVSGTSLRGRRV